MALLFSPQYRLVFGEPWPVWAAALLVAMVNVFLFAFDRPWTASDGMRNWGDWVLTGVGVNVGLRPKSRTSSSGVTLTRQKFVYTVDRAAASVVTCSWRYAL